MEPTGSKQSLELNFTYNQDVKQSPIFKELFNTLLQLTNEHPFVKSGIRGSYAEDFDIVRKRYVRIAILKEIVNASLAFISSTKPNITDSGKYKILNELSEASALVDLQSYIQPIFRDSNKSIIEEKKSEIVIQHLFGIDVKTLRQKALSLLTNKHKELLRDRVHHILLERCNKIISFSFPDEVFETPSDGMTALVRHVSEQKKNVDSERMLLIKQRQYNSALMKLVLQQLIEYGNALETLVEKHRFSSHPLPHLEFFSASNKTYLLKLRCLEMEAMTSTYNKATVKALKKLRQEVDLALEKIMKELAQVEHRLSAYEGLDPNFHELLREYVSLQKDIQFIKV